MASSCGRAGVGVRGARQRSPGPSTLVTSRNQPDHVAVIFGTTAVRTLDRSECLSLLASSDRGRVALSNRALPTIVPVSFRLVDEEVVIDVCDGILADAAAAGCIVCLQTDHFEALTVPTWTVSVTGPLTIREWPASGPISATLDTAAVAGCALDDHGG